MALVKFKPSVLYPKIVGTISLLLGLEILYRSVVEGLALAKISHFMNALVSNSGWANGLAMGLSLAIAALAIFLGVRGILFNNICIGGQCNIEPDRT